MRPDQLRGLLVALSICLALCVGAAHAHAQEPGATSGHEAPRRIALLIGANAAAPGRKPLRYAQQDAEGLGRVLVELGGFAREDVAVLLDPDPAQVLASLDAQLARVRGSGREAMFVFYYSGHADATALYPHGRPLALADLRTRFSDPRVSLRIGIIDACRGGGWTGTKGLSETAPFEVDLPSALASEGSVLIASSSGLEDAHESETLGGSFFTHHWIAALRGAADRNGDGQVTLNESFEYARAYTIRDTALHTASPQHPSFAMQLKGRHDLPLVTLHAASSVLAVDQREGPLELVHLDSGVIVLEVPKGPRNLRLAVVPGRYVLRRRDAGKVWAQEFEIRPGQSAHIDEQGLTLVGNAALAIKSAAPRPLTLTTLPRGKQELTVWLGVSHGAGLGATFAAASSGPQIGLVAPRGLTDRWQWILPTFAFVYRGGEHGGLEWLPWGGLVSWGMGGSSIEGFVATAQPGAGFDLRWWLTQECSLDFSLGMISMMRWRSKQEDAWTQDMQETNFHTPPYKEQWIPPTTWRAGLSLGFNYTLADTVTLHLALSLNQRQWLDGEFTDHHPRSAEGDMRVAIGSVQTIALRPQPLVRVHIRDWIALNVDASVAFELAHKSVDERYLGGASFFW